jgi:hypothetical protein
VVRKKAVASPGTSTPANRVARYNAYRCVHKRGIHGTCEVGIREFREKLAAYLLEGDAPVAITRHGDTVGYFIPARRKRSVTERAALKQAAAA